MPGARLVAIFPNRKHFSVRRDSFGASSRIRAHTRLTSQERQRLDCASSHHWSRELQTLGPTVRLMPPAYVKPYVKRHKNDSVDAEAICEDRQNSN